MLPCVLPLKLTHLKSKIYLQRFNIRPLRNRFTALLPGTDNEIPVGGRPLRSVKNKNKHLKKHNLRLVEISCDDSDIVPGDSHQAGGSDHVRSRPCETNTKLGGNKEKQILVLCHINVTQVTKTI